MKPQTWSKDWKPDDAWADCLPHRVLFSNWDFTLDSREFSPRANCGRKTSINHGSQFQTWLDEFKVGEYQIFYWGDSYHWQAANDEIHVVWSFCFEREVDAVLFKLCWM